MWRRVLAVEFCGAAAGALVAYAVTDHPRLYTPVEGQQQRAIVRGPETSEQGEKVDALVAVKLAAAHVSFTGGTTDGRGEYEQRWGSESTEWADPDSATPHMTWSAKAVLQTRRVLSHEADAFPTRAVCERRQWHVAQCAVIGAVSASAGLMLLPARRLGFMATLVRLLTPAVLLSPAVTLLVRRLLPVPADEARRGTFTVLPDDQGVLVQRYRVEHRRGMADVAVYETLLLPAAAASIMEAADDVADGVSVTEEVKDVVRSTAVSGAVLMALSAPIVVPCGVVATVLWRSMLS